MSLFSSLNGPISWVESNFVRPMLVMGCGMMLYHLKATMYKIQMTFGSLLYLFICNDKSWPKEPDPGSIFGPHLSAGQPVERKRIYFVRHGESTWNDTFNKGSHRSAQAFVIGFIPGLIKAFFYEWYLLLIGKIDSWFYDAPLSQLGLSQTKELKKFLSSSNNTMKGEEAESLKVLRSDPGAPASKMVCSNLRRAVSTMVGGFAERLQRRRNQDKIIILGSLQEISRNPDTLSITPAHTPVQASWIEADNKELCDFQDIFNNQLDMSLHKGNKPIDTNGMKRMKEFCSYVFSSSKEDHIIVGGHSIWFRSFFQCFLPYSVSHPSKKQKIVNGGIVTFELMKAEKYGRANYMIDPKTIRIIYGGFS